MGFYENLTGNGVFFFWIAVALACFLIGLSVSLLFKNKKLSVLLKREEEKQIALPIVKKEEEEEKKEEPLIEIKNDKEKQVNIEDKIEEKDIEIDKKVEPEIKKKEEMIEIKLEESKPLEVPKKEEEIVFADEIENNKKEVSKAYQKNVLREMSKKMPTSPIHIEREDYGDVSVNTVSSEPDYDLDGIDLREDNTNPLEEMEDAYEVNDSMKFAGEALSKMEEERMPSNIELNDFEKKQEEEAIISYDELQQVKDKIYNLTEDEETDEFIDELKEFRLDLK